MTNESHIATTYWMISELFPSSCMKQARRLLFGFRNHRRSSPEVSWACLLYGNSIGSTEATAKHTSLAGAEVIDKSASGSLCSQCPYRGEKCLGALLGTVVQCNHASVSAHDMS